MSNEENEARWERQDAFNKRLGDRVDALAPRLGGRIDVLEREMCEFKSVMASHLEQSAATQAVLSELAKSISDARQEATDRHHMLTGAIANITQIATGAAARADGAIQETREARDEVAATAEAARKDVAETAGKLSMAGKMAAAGWTALVVLLTGWAIAAWNAIGWKDIHAILDKASGP